MALPTTWAIRYPAWEHGALARLTTHDDRRPDVRREEEEEEEEREQPARTTSRA